MSLLGGLVQRRVAQLVLHVHPHRAALAAQQVAHHAELTEVAGHVQRRVPGFGLRIGFRTRRHLGIKSCFNFQTERDKYVDRLR